MKRSLAIALEIAPALTVFLSVPCCILCFHLGLAVKSKRTEKDVATLQSHLDHERFMNWLLARRVGEQEKGKQ